MAKFKSGLLLVLVAISVYQAAVLMSGHPAPGLPDPEGNTWFGPAPDLFEASLPGRIYVIDTGGEMRLVETFSTMYDDLTATLTQIQYEPGAGGTEWVAGDYAGEGFPPGVLFRYDYQISREMLSEWLLMFYETDFPFACIDSIFIPLESGPVQFINSSTKEVWYLRVSLPRSVIELAATTSRNTISFRWNAMEEGHYFSVGAGVYDIAGPEVMVVPAWDYDEVNIDAMIQSFYYLMPSLIQEPDGTKIFTDGLQALRIYPSGSIEYTYAGSERDTIMPTQRELAEAALRFTSLHGGWPKNTLPTELGILPAQNVRLEFSSFGLGLPVTGEAALVMEMAGLTISGYQRNLIQVRTDVIEGFVEILPLSWHLSNSSTQIEMYLSEANLEVTDLALVYYLSGEQLIPAWRIWLGRQEIYVGAADGRILNVKEPVGGN